MQHQNIVLVSLSSASHLVLSRWECSDGMTFHAWIFADSTEMVVRHTGWLPAMHVDLLQSASRVQNGWSQSFICNGSWNVAFTLFWHWENCKQKSICWAFNCGFCCWHCKWSEGLSLSASVMKLWATQKESENQMHEHNKAGIDLHWSCCCFHFFWWQEQPPSFFISHQTNSERQQPSLIFNPCVAQQNMFKTKSSSLTVDWFLIILEVLVDTCDGVCLQISWLHQCTRFPFASGVNNLTPFRKGAGQGLNPNIRTCAFSRCTSPTSPMWAATKQTEKMSKCETH